ncbi:ribosome maturation factor RimM [Thermogemmatispora tikiterensis]|uniref:Ribosome maturation factor RimM n=1 Tax=Thermogemmatispora tikiterensis TaxID=1825093 RepID=A0A328VH09_9CHLR|nr:ribosome maturation factor RimM [Thermogemmatispora tikiterensis]RAQ95392.1 16S rRNA processing protein RimM [Thermogemmatispora tikiterensis]
MTASSIQGNMEWATVGRVIAPFGLRGEIKVLPMSDLPDRFAQLEAIYCGSPPRRHRIEHVRPYKSGLVLLKLQGFDSLTAAEALRNCELQIPLAELPPLPPDSYYQHDILNLRVFTLDGQEVGSITEIWLTGSNDVYAIRMPDGRQALIPAVKEVIKQIDLVRRTMYIDPLPGMLDEQEAIIDRGELEEDVDDASEEPDL